MHAETTVLAKYVPIRPYLPRPRSDALVATPRFVALASEVRAALRDASRDAPREPR